MITKKEFKEHIKHLLKYKKSFEKIDSTLAILNGGNGEGLLDQIYSFMDFHVYFLEKAMQDDVSNIGNFIWFPEDCKDSNGNKITSIDKLYKSFNERSS
jgi:flagellin-specific chaperone FliS